MHLKSNDIDMMKCEIDNDCDIEDVKWFNDFMQENSYKVFGKECYINKRSKKTYKCKNKAWFNKTCYNARRLFNRARNSTDAARTIATKCDFQSRSAERPTRPRGAI